MLFKDDKLTNEKAGGGEIFKSRRHYSNRISDLFNVLRGVLHSDIKLLISDKHLVGRLVKRTQNTERLQYFIRT